ncbi:MAG: hypothetical protein KGH63_01025, partial [Candidatus Micrarchaeota archaeon]|nr:hypothetical protein [Candidatus Micrarchaeota archaeon]
EVEFGYKRPGVGETPPELQAAVSAGKLMTKVSVLLVYNRTPSMEASKDFMSIDELVQLMKYMNGYKVNEDGTPDTNTDAYRELFVNRYSYQNERGRMTELPPLLPAWNGKAFSSDAILSAVWVTRDKDGKLTPVPGNDPGAANGRAEIFYYAATPEQEKQYNGFVRSRRFENGRKLPGESAQNPLTPVLESYRGWFVRTSDVSQLRFEFTDPSQGRTYKQNEDMNFDFKLTRIITPAAAAGQK